MLSELLRNKKCYYSLIKRSENFKVIDDEVKNILKNSKQDIQQLTIKVNELSTTSKLIAPTQGTTVDMKGTLDFIDEILDSTGKISRGFVLSFIARRYRAIGISSIENFIRDIVEEETHDAFTNIKIYDTIVVFKEISIGLNDPIYFYDYNENIYTLDDISGISDILRLDSDYLPVFYIYILLKDKEELVKEKRETLLKQIGNQIGKKIVDKIIKILKKQISQMEDSICVE